MKKLLIGFDSAWTRHKKGALAGAITTQDGCQKFVLRPTTVDFPEARKIINGLIQKHAPHQTVIFLDQPHIVANTSGARPVERIVTSLVSRRHGGMQTASTDQPERKRIMFGKEAPVWEFLRAFGGPANPFVKADNPILVFETYPVLYLIANGWVIPDQRPGGKLPKYNPERRKTFRLQDWQFLCRKATQLAQILGSEDLSRWFADAQRVKKPLKRDQDRLDAMLCLLQAIEWEYSESFLVIGNMESGYILTKSHADMLDELRVRCDELEKTAQRRNWSFDQWVTIVRKNGAAERCAI